MSAVAANRNSESEEASPATTMSPLLSKVLPFRARKGDWLKRTIPLKLPRRLEVKVLFERDTVQVCQEIETPLNRGVVETPQGKEEAGEEPG